MAFNVLFSTDSLKEELSWLLNSIDKIEKPKDDSPRYLEQFKTDKSFPETWLKCIASDDFIASKLDDMANAIFSNKENLELKIYWGSRGGSFFNCIILTDKYLRYIELVPFFENIENNWFEYCVKTSLSAKNRTVIIQPLIKKLIAFNGMIEKVSGGTEVTSFFFIIYKNGVPLHSFTMYGSNYNPEKWNGYGVSAMTLRNMLLNFCGLDINSNPYKVKIPVFN